MILNKCRTFFCEAMALSPRDTVMQFTSLDHSTQEMSGSEDGSHIFEVFVLPVSNLGTVNTMFAALFSKLGVPIKTTISANVLEEPLNSTVTVRLLPIGTTVSRKAEKQGAHFFGVTINEQQAKSGLVIRVTSTAQSKFKI